MSRTSSRAWIAYGLAGGVIAADQLVKTWILGPQGLALGQSRAVWGPFYLTRVENHGISFGLFQSDADWTRWAMAGFSLLVAALLAVWARRSERPVATLAMGLVIGGAVGNAIDRIRLGAVTDFIDVQRLAFPWVFNVADSAISVGIVLLMLDSLFAPKTAAQPGQS